MGNNDTSGTAGTDEVIVAGPTTTTVLVGGAETGGRSSVVVMEVGPGWEGPPAHVHREVEHVWYVLAGTIDLVVDGEAARHGPGACAHVAAGRPHTFSTAGCGPATVLEVDSPRALDGYFRELGAVLGAGPPDPGRVAEIMRRHDTVPVGAGAHS